MLTMDDLESELDRKWPVERLWVCFNMGPSGVPEPPHYLSLLGVAKAVGFYQSRRWGAGARMSGELPTYYPNDPYYEPIDPNKLKKRKRR